MQDDLIRKIAGLMAEQSAAYTSLRSLTSQLIAALTVCEPASIETLARSGEKELFRMRARLLEITTALTEFGKIRETQAELTRLDPAAREEFEKQANLLLEAARSFQKIAGRASSLTVGGTSFAAAAIQMCGIPPTTYNAPVLKYSKGATA
jgi:BMFP domain-containing protein YqiC